jgi:hypothetical protein
MSRASRPATSQSGSNRRSRRCAATSARRVDRQGRLGEQSSINQKATLAAVPFAIFVIVILLMLQLQNVKRMLVVLATGPLALIGVALIMALFRIPFGFVAMLGSLALFGMVLRNSVILIAQIDTLSGHGLPMREAVREAAVHRLRPIMLTALAAILAMIPLTRSTFWGPMAWAIMGGLMVATILTLIVLPALYELVFDRPQRCAGRPGDFRMKHFPFPRGRHARAARPCDRPCRRMAAAALHDPIIWRPGRARCRGESAVQARALKRPSVQFQGGYQYNVTETNARCRKNWTRSSPAAGRGRASVAVQAVQPLYDASKHAQSIQLREKAAGADVQFAGEQQQLILRVSQAYFKVLAARTG